MFNDISTIKRLFIGSPVCRRGGRQGELSAFISNELARHHKRPASHDVDMGSPTHKRMRTTL